MYDIFKWLWNQFRIQEKFCTVVNVYIWGPLRPIQYIAHNFYDKFSINISKLMPIKLIAPLSGIIIVSLYQTTRLYDDEFAVSNTSDQSQSSTVTKKPAVILWQWLRNSISASITIAEKKCFKMLSFKCLLHRPKFNRPKQKLLKNTPKNHKVLLNRPYLNIFFINSQCPWELW